MWPSRTVARLIALAVMVGAGAVAAQTAPSQVIGQRQEAMKGLGGAMKTLTPMVRGEQPWNQAEAVKAATTINNVSKAIPQVFPPGSGPESGVKTAALPIIWQQNADYQVKAKALEEASGVLLGLAQAGNADGVKSQFGNLGKACGGCHEVYRAK